MDGKPTSDRKETLWFHFEEVDLKWLPVSESAFLLWVLALLVAFWLGLGAALGLV